MGHELTDEERTEVLCARLFLADRDRPAPGPWESLTELQQRPYRAMAQAAADHFRTTPAEHAEHGDTPDLTEQIAGWVTLAGVWCGRPDHEAASDGVTLCLHCISHHDFVAEFIARRLSARSAVAPDTAARPTPGPDAATALREAADEIERELICCTAEDPCGDRSGICNWSRCCQSLVLDRADRLAAASPTPDPATEDTETLARVREVTEALFVVSSWMPDDEKWLATYSAGHDAARRAVRAVLDPGTRDHADQGTRQGDG